MMLPTSQTATISTEDLMKQQYKVIFPNLNVWSIVNTIPLIQSFCLLLWKHIPVIIVKNVPKVASNFCSSFPLLSLIDFLQCTFMAGFQKFSESLWNNLKSHRRLLEIRNKLPDEGYRYRKGFQNYRISKWFQRSKQKLHFGVHSQKQCYRTVTIFFYYLLWIWFLLLTSYGSGSGYGSVTRP